MAYSITSAKSELSAILHGTSVNKIINLYGVFNRAARDVLIDCDPNETIRTLPIANPVFQKVYDYPAPADLKGNRVIDIAPQVDRQSTDIWQQIYPQAFDVTKGFSFMDDFAVTFNAFVKTLRINSPFSISPIVLNTCDSLNGNGTWSVGGNASGLVVDNQNFVSSAGSLQFNLTASGTTGYLENSTETAQDLSAWLNQGTLFLYTYLPTPTSITKVNLRFGSSSSNYYSVDATLTQSGTVFQTGWNLLQFPWLGASVTGTPDPTKINYVRVTWTTDGTLQTAVRLDQITASLGTIMNISYYSKFMFRDAVTGAFQETVTDDTNLINLDTETLNIWLYKVAELAVQQQQGLDAMFYDGAYFQKEYNDALTRYLYLYKSQTSKVHQTYYKLARPNPNLAPRVTRGF